MKFTSLPGRKLLVVGIVAGVVSACGGGGGGTVPTDGPQSRPIDSSPAQDSTSVASVLTFDIETGFNNYFMTNATYNLSAKDARGRNYQVTEQVIGNPSTCCTYDPNNDVRSSFLGQTLAIDGVLQQAAGAPFPSTNNWGGIGMKMGSPFTIIGYSEFNTPKKLEQSYPMPSTAKVGESGNLALGAEKTWVTGTRAEQDLFGWSLEADTAETAWLCFTERELVTVGTTSSPSDVQAKRCAKITPAGRVVGVKADVIDGAEILRFR